MRISLLVQGSPHSSDACRQALQFAKAVIEENHELFRVFFYKDAALIANRSFQVPTDEWNVQEAWQDFARQNNLRLEVCVGAAQRRGVEAPSTESESNSGFEIVGLGQFAEAAMASDRLVTFN